MAANRLTAGQSADGLVYDSLEDRGRKILLGGSFIDERLDIGLGKDAAAGRNGIERLITFRIFIQTGCIGLKKRSHLIDKGAGASGADTVHTLFYIAAFKIDDFGIFPAQFDCHVSLGGKFL